jgi:hypothetical protein
MISRWAVGLDDFLVAAIIPIGFGTLCLQNSSGLRGRHRTVLVLWISIILSGISFGVLQSMMYLDELVLPIEMWQYVKRMVFFYLGVYISLRNRVSPERMYSVFVYTLLGTCLIGVLQVIPGGVGSLLSDMYARTDTQLEKLAERHITGLRNYGVAGFATAWGGFSVFATVMGLTGLVIGSGKGEGLRMPSLALTILSLFNVFLSGSKVALVSLLALALCTAVAAILLAPSKIWSFLKLSVIFGLTGVLVHYFLAGRAAYILYRFYTLIERGSQDSRYLQIQTGLGLLQDWYAWVTGVGNAYQRAAGVSWGLEVEQVYILVVYGVFGFVLRYLLLLVIFYVALFHISKSNGFERILTICTCFSIVCYMILSTGYFFFRELYVGLLPWILFGYVFDRSNRRRFRFADMPMGSRRHGNHCSFDISASPVRHSHSI